MKKMTTALTTPEPAPVHNDAPATWDLVITDMHQRNADGVAKYGTPLQPGNGRRSLVDAYQEGLDQVVYLRNEIEERKAVDQRIAFLENALAKAQGILMCEKLPEAELLATLIFIITKRHIDARSAECRVKDAVDRARAWLVGVRANAVKMGIYKAARRTRKHAAEINVPDVAVFFSSLAKELDSMAAAKEDVNATGRK